MNRSKFKSGLFMVLALGTCVLAGCGGTKVLSEARPMQVTRPLAVASGEGVTTRLDWVIVRDGPGTWAKNADWDEYLLRVDNQSETSIQLTGLVVVDSLDTRVEPQTGRKPLVKASKKAARRYKDSGIKVKAGAGVGTMLVAGAAVSVLAVGAAEVAALGAIMGGTGVGAGATAAVGGLVLLAPVLVVGGILKAVNNSEVNTEIEKRQTTLPLEVAAGEEKLFHVFFPITPSPGMVELRYSDQGTEKLLVLNTHAALNGLHLEKPKAEEAKGEAALAD